MNIRDTVMFHTKHKITYKSYFNDWKSELQVITLRFTVFSPTYRNIVTNSKRNRKITRKSENIVLDNLPYARNLKNEFSRRSSAFMTKECSAFVKSIYFSVKRYTCPQIRCAVERSVYITQWQIWLLELACRTRVVATHSTTVIDWTPDAIAIITEKFVVYSTMMNTPEVSVYIGLRRPWRNLFVSCFRRHIVGQALSNVLLSRYRFLGHIAPQQRSLWRYSTSGYGGA